MKKILTFLLLSLFSAHIALADDISVEQALQVASQFAITSQPNLAKVKGYRAPRKVPTPRLVHAMPSKVAASKNNVYVINLGNDQGFVIVSGESGTDEEILGYCDHGSFSYEDAPIQLKELLDNYTSEIDRLRSNPSMVAKSPRKAKNIGNVVVAPLITTKWNQWAPYNMFCPVAPDGGMDGYSGRCPTGCVPTAFAQIMNYYKWPKESYGHLYDYKTGLFTGEDFSGHVYDWDNMGNEEPQTWEEWYAVAHLMADIGKSMGTNYKSDESPTTWSTVNVSYNFSYEQAESQHGYPNADDLMNVMKRELDELHPIPYVGFRSPDPGHALVCDGYTSNNFFHFNYGWGGSCDGYYKPSALPMFSPSGEALIGFRPNKVMKVIEIDHIRYGLNTDGNAYVVEYDPKGPKEIALNIPDAITYEGKDYPVTRILKQAFYNRGHFTKMTIGGNIKVIDQYSFIYSTIDTLVIGDKMEEVPDAAFQTTRIKHLTIGASIKRIGKQAFMMCSLADIISRSPGFEVDDEAFLAGGTGTADGDGSWLGCITKLGSRVFASNTFNISPRFTSLRELGPEAFYACGFTEEKLHYTAYNGESRYWNLKLFHVYPSLKKISPSAFENTDLYGFVVEEGSPYFSIRPDRLYSKLLFNKDGSSLVVSLPQHYTTSIYGRSWESLHLGNELWELFTDNVVRLEPGSIHSLQYESFHVTIPNTVVEMEGAFTNCERLNSMTLPFEFPPTISASSFNDKLFADIDNRPNLYVPVGSEELYRNSPCWRRFRVRGDAKITPMPPQDREYRMVVHRSGNGLQNVNIPLSDMSDMHTDGEDVVIRRHGQDDVSTSAVLLDSITFVPSFVLENAEVFDLNDSILTVDAQKCSVKFSPTAIEGDVQLCIRNSVLTPRPFDGVVRGQAIDLSLSTDVHELCGVARITIPFEQREGETVCAAYLNEESNEWEPVYFRYDEEEQEAVIITDHLSMFGVFSVVNDNTRAAYLRAEFESYLSYQDLNTAIEKLLFIASSDDPEAAAIRAWKDDVAFWQSVGIDGGYSLLTALGFESEFIGNFCDIMGNVGTAVTCLDVIGAAINGDNIGVASNTLKVIMAATVGKMASAIGTSIMSASMGLVAFVGVALEKLGTTVQQAKVSLFRKAYRYYYSEECDVIGGDAPTNFNGGKKPYRSAQDWYEVFRPAFDKGWTHDRLMIYIEQVIRNYTEWFWMDNKTIYDYCMAEKDVISMTSYMYPDEYTQKTISEEFYAELCSRVIPDVFQAIKDDLEAKAAKKYQRAVRQLTTQVNTKVSVRFKDSSRKDGEKSQFAGWTVRFSEVPDSVKDKNFWQCRLDDRGEGDIGFFSEYAIIRNKIPCKLSLVSPGNVEHKSFDFTIPQGTGKLFIDIDLAKDGIEVEAPELADLKLTYEPDYVKGWIKLEGTRENDEPWGPTSWSAGILPSDPDFDDSETYAGTIFLRIYENVRFQTEIEKFFKEHDNISIDNMGNIHIGNDIVGQMTENGLESRGSFSIDTSYPFVVQSIEDFAANWMDLWTLHSMLNGTMNHKIDCQFTVYRSNETSKEFTVSYTGTGTYHLDAEVVEIINGINGDHWNDSEYDHHITPDNIITRQASGDGTVKLEFTTKLVAQ